MYQGSNLEGVLLPLTPKGSFGLQYRTRKRLQNSSEIREFRVEFEVRFLLSTVKNLWNSLEVCMNKT